MFRGKSAPFAIRQNDSVNFTKPAKNVDAESRLSIHRPHGAAQMLGHSRNAFWGLGKNHQRLVVVRIGNNIALDLAFRLKVALDLDHISRLYGSGKPFAHVLRKGDERARIEKQSINLAKWSDEQTAHFYLGNGYCGRESLHMQEVIVLIMTFFARAMGWKILQQ